MRRKSTYPIHQVMLKRWSPRAMSGESISEKELFTLLEAARWAPSSFNNQPWKFIFARKGTPFWKPFLELLSKSNRTWARHAGVLIILASQRTHTHNGKYSQTHSFDTGAAWENLALQATFMDDIVTHAMEGFDYEKAKQLAGIDEEHEVEAMIAIGRPGDITTLPIDLQQAETHSERKDMDEIAFEGIMKKQEEV